MRQGFVILARRSITTSQWKGQRALVCSLRHLGTAMTTVNARQSADFSSYSSILLLITFSTLGSRLMLFLAA